MRRWLNHRLRGIVALLKLAVGWFLLVVGIITAPLPLPIGQAIALVGLAILVHESIWVRDQAIRLRRRNPRLCGSLNRLKRRLPGFLRRVIESTDPAMSQRAARTPNAVQPAE